MDYDFSVLCNDQVEKLGKRLESLSKTFIKEYKIALGCISTEAVNENWDEIFNNINEAFSFNVARSRNAMRETLEKVKAELGKHL